MKFFTVRDNSGCMHNYPWGARVIEGFHYLPPCALCRSEAIALDEEIEIQLMENKGSKWPDALGCIEFHLLILSQGAIEAWRREKLGNLPLRRIRIGGKTPRRLKEHTQPEYCCVDGPSLRGAELDADASGYVGVHRCPKCGSWLYDLAATREKQHSQKYPFAIDFRTWGGMHLFTTSLERRRLFCTEEFVRMARNYRLTNFRFVPAEDRDSSDHQGLDYLADSFAS